MSGAKSCYGLLFFLLSPWKCLLFRWQIENSSVWFNMSVSVIREFQLSFQIFIEVLVISISKTSTTINVNDLERQSDMIKRILAWLKAFRNVYILPQGRICNVPCISRIDVEDLEPKSVYSLFFFNFNCKLSSTFSNWPDKVANNVLLRYNVSAQRTLSIMLLWLVR